MTRQLINSIAVIGLLFMAGGLCRRFRLLDTNAEKSLGRLVIYIFMPALIFYSYMTQFDPARIKQALFLPLFSLCLYCFYGGAAWAALRLSAVSSCSRDRKRTFIHLISVNNFSFIPIPLVYLLFGGEGLGILFMHNIGGAIWYWSAGAWLLKGRLDKSSLRSVFNPALIMIALSCVLVMAGIKLGEANPLMRSIRFLGYATVPLIMVVTGSMMSAIDRKGLRGHMPEIFLVCLMRLIILPLCVLVFVKMAGLRGMTAEIIVLVAAMPSASSAPVLTQEFGGDTAFAASAVLVTTLASAVTVPLIVSLI